MEWAEVRIVDLGCARDNDGHGQYSLGRRPGMQVWVDDPELFVLF